MNRSKGWLVGPVLYFILLGALLVTWSVMEPAALVHFFDQKGYSPFELATIPFFLAIVPCVWYMKPFTGSRRRQVILSLAVSVVAVMAVVKELDLHLMALHALFPDFVSETGSMMPGLFKPDGRPLGGTPFKLRVLTNAGVPLAMKGVIMVYFALFFGSFAAGLLYLLPTWIKGVFKLDASAWAFGCCGGSGVLVQISDRLPAWLGHADGLGRKSADVVTSATSLCTCLEEGGELMLAVFAILTMVLSNGRKADR